MIGPLRHRSLSACIRFGRAEARCESRASGNARSIHYSLSPNSSTHTHTHSQGRPMGSKRNPPLPWTSKLIHPLLSHPPPSPHPHPNDLVGFPPLHEPFVSPSGLLSRLASPIRETWRKLSISPCWRMPSCFRHARRSSPRCWDEIGPTTSRRICTFTVSNVPCGGPRSLIRDEPNVK